MHRFEREEDLDNEECWDYVTDTAIKYWNKAVNSGIDERTAMKMLLKDYATSICNTVIDKCE
jgi:hypothetical protein